MLRLLVAFLCVLNAVALAERVRVEVVAGRTAATPGESIPVAVVLHVDPGWHVYWLNPGDTGAPPKVKWALPTGFTAGRLRFPTPHRIDVGDGLTAFGYETQLALLTTVHVPPDAKGTLDLGGTLSCVVCQDTCLSETHPVRLRLPIGTGEPVEPGRFAAWQAALPSAESGTRPVTLAADGSGGSLDHPLADGETPIDFFPPAADNLEYARPTEVNVDGRRTYRLTFKNTGGPVSTDIGTAVVVVTLPDGRVRSREVHYGSAPATTTPAARTPTQE